MGEPFCVRCEKWTTHVTRTCNSTFCRTCFDEQKDIVLNPCIFTGRSWKCLQALRTSLCTKCGIIGHLHTTCVCTTCTFCKEDSVNHVYNPCHHVKTGAGKWICLQGKRIQQCGRCGGVGQGPCFAAACTNCLTVPQVNSDPPSYRCQFYLKSCKSSPNGGWVCRFRYWRQGVMLGDLQYGMEGRVCDGQQGKKGRKCTRCSLFELCVCRVPTSRIGSLSVSCPPCGARTFPLEKLDCCGKGKVCFPPIQPLPDEILQMFPKTERSLSVPEFVRYWRQHSRAFNTAFAFASTVMKPATFKSHGPSVLVLTGQIMRLIWNGIVTPEMRKHPSFAQIYYFTKEVTERIAVRKGLQCLSGTAGDVSDRLLTLLENVMTRHPLAAKYKSNYVAHPEAPTAVLTLEETGRSEVADHSGAYDSHTNDPIAGLLPNCSTQESLGFAPRQLLPNCKNAFHLRPLSSISGEADMHQYPLLNWHVDPKTSGWSAFLPTCPKSKKRISCAAFYRYRLMVSVYFCHQFDHFTDISFCGTRFAMWT